ncbi:MAG: sulfotransferase family 2 domain-containing protein [Akkermansiaceae bacterium]
MYYYVVPDLKLILGWSPKCACTTAKTAIFEALGQEIVGNVHNDMLTNENLNSGLYGVYYFSAFKALGQLELDSFRKFCIIRNPYSRFISAIRQRSHALIKHSEFQTMNAGDYLQYLETNRFGTDHHFDPQTKNLRQFSFDQVLDISQMSVFFDYLKVDYTGNQKFGSHSTNYGVEEDMQESSLLEIAKKRVFPRKIQAWLRDGDITRLRKIYSNDFTFARSHNFDFELP